MIFNNASQALERELAREGRLRPFATQALANSLWSFATLRYFPSGPCFCALIDEVSVNMDGLKEQARTERRVEKKHMTWLVI